MSFITPGILKMRTWRKGGLWFLTGWVEISFIALLAVGFALGKLIIDAAFLYLLAAAVGLIAGRLTYQKREDNPWTVYAISLAFLVGYLSGHRIGNGVIITAIFVAVAALSYKLHASVEFLT